MNDTLKDIHNCLIDAKMYLKTGRILKASQCISTILLITNIQRKRVRNAENIQTHKPPIVQAI